MAKIVLIDDSSHLPVLDGIGFVNELKTLPEHESTHGSASSPRTA
jgi:hypothetical protein